LSEIRTGTGGVDRLGSVDGALAIEGEGFEAGFAGRVGVRGGGLDVLVETVEKGGFRGGEVFDAIEDGPSAEDGAEENGGRVEPGESALESGDAFLKTKEDLILVVGHA
jgi:hypothetical protein